MSEITGEFFPQHHRPGLFRSHAWLSAWHEHWSGHPAISKASAKKNDVDANNLENQIYLSRQLIKKLLPVTTAFPLGVSTTVAPSIRSEYFLFPDSAGDRVADFLDRALHLAWDQFYIPDILVSNVEYSRLFALARARNLDVVTRESEATYGVNVDGDFNSYLATLGKHTRLKLFNRRKNLEAFGLVTIENVWPDKAGFFALLNRFHQKRWGKPCYQDRNLAFMHSLLDNLSGNGHEIDLSIMYVSGEAVSAALDIKVNHRQYNLQSGYQESFATNIALGTLHLGYQIESAFNNKSIDIYDFMAGTGKKSDYKRSLANCSDQFATLLLVRSPLLKFAYRLHNRYLR